MVVGETYYYMGVHIPGLLKESRIFTNEKDREIYIEGLVEIYEPMYTKGKDGPKNGVLPFIHKYRIQREVKKNEQKRKVEVLSET